MALGSERFKDEIEGLCNRRVRPGKMGRPRLRHRMNKFHLTPLILHDGIQCIVPEGIHTQAEHT